MARPLNEVLSESSERMGQFNQSAVCDARKLRTVINRCTCVWLTAYNVRYVKPPPIISENQVCRSVGFGLNLIGAINGS